MKPLMILFILFSQLAYAPSFTFCQRMQLGLTDRESAQRDLDSSPYRPAIDVSVYCTAGGM